MSIGVKCAFVSFQEQNISGLFLYSFFPRKEPLLAALCSLVAFIPFSPLSPMKGHEAVSTNFPINSRN